MLNNRNEKVLNENQPSLLDLPKELMVAEIPRYLSNKEEKITTMKALSATCKTLNGIFKTALQKARVKKLHDYFITAQTHQLSDSAKRNLASIFNTNYHLVDLSQRQFHNTSAIQYAYWAGDWQTLRIFLAHLKTDQEVAPEVFLENLRQFELQLTQIDQQGTNHGHHFDFQPLIVALQTYVQNYTNWNEQERDRFWRKDVGGQQRMLPAYIAYYYCDKYIRFSANSCANGHGGNDLSNLNFYDLIKKETVSWFPLSADGGLGFDYAVASKGIDYVTCPAAFYTAPPVELVQDDLAALQALKIKSEREIDQFSNKLKSYLADSDDASVQTSAPTPSP